MHGTVIYEFNYEVHTTVTGIVEYTIKKNVRLRKLPFSLLSPNDVGLRSIMIISLLVVNLFEVVL